MKIKFLKNTLIIIFSFVIIALLAFIDIRYKCFLSKLAFCMLTTGIIETLFFYLCMHNEPKTLLYIFGINLLSNFILNFSFTFYGRWLHNFFSSQIKTNPEAVKFYLPVYVISVLTAEFLVVVFEYFTIGYKIGRTGKTMFFVTMANVLSFTLGLIYYSLYKSL